jgi:hypothetical protein
MTRWWDSSAVLKLTQAKHHLESIDSEIGDFFHHDPYVTATEANHETGEHLVRLVNMDEPPIQVSLMVGDVLHNLRSALDHIVWERSAPEKRDTNTGFPLLVKPPRGSFDNVPSARGLSKTNRAIVERLQPYKARDPDEIFDQPLRVLHDLNITDKHRFIHLTWLSLEASRLRPVARGGTIRHTEAFPGPLELDAVLARVVVSPPEAQVDMNFAPTFDIAFETGTTPWRDMPVVPTLEILVGAVEDALGCFRWNPD